MVKLATYVLLFLSIQVKGQTYILPNEEVLFSFETKKNKKIVICQDRNEKYLVYRLGSEFEFPQQKDSTSFSRFTYSYWIRGSSNSKSALDLKYLTFEHEGFKYIVYDIYFEENNSHQIGVRVMNLATQEITDIKGIRSTQKGSLDAFRDNDRVNQSNAAYD